MTRPTGSITLRLATLAVVLLLGGAARPAHAWDSEELEIFDLVEDIAENFYTFVGQPPDCTLGELKRAFRTLSVQLHPDKNNGIDEGNRFRKLVAIYEVLKDSTKRAKYDLVLKNGLPNWKSAMFYYRRVHRMGMVEMVAIVFAIVTVGQYLCSWAAYAEKKYTADALIGSKLRRRKGAAAGGHMADAMLDEIPRPSVLVSVWLAGGRYHGEITNLFPEPVQHTLPFQIPLAIWRTPGACLGAYRHYREYQLEQAAIAAEAEAAAEAVRQRDEEYQRDKEAKKLGVKKRKEKFAVQEKSDAELEGFAKLQHIKKLESIQAARSRADALAASAAGLPSAGGGNGGLWTDDDLIELIRLVKKHPGGTPARWETIAEQMARSVSDVTFMAAKMKEKGYRLPGQTTATMATGSVAETLVQVAETQQKLQQQCAPTIAVPETTNWSQQQQRQLETAMIKYPKAVPGDRWSLIAGAVDGKSRDECVDRYKHLVQMLRAQKSPTATTAETAEQPAQSSAAGAGVGGKRRNKRKERKKNMDFSCSEEDDGEDE